MSDAEAKQLRQEITELRIDLRILTEQLRTSVAVTESSTPRLLCRIAGASKTLPQPPNHGTRTY